MYVCVLYFNLHDASMNAWDFLFKDCQSLVYVYAAMCSNWQTLVQHGSWPQERRSSPSMAQRSTSTLGCMREPL